MLEDDSLISQQFGIIPTTCTPTFQYFCILSVGFNLCTFSFVPFFYPSHTFVVRQGWASFMTWTVVEMATHCFKDSVTMLTNSINTKAINLLLSTSCNIAFNPTFGTSLLKIRKVHIFEKACFVLSRHEFLRFRVIVPSCVQSIWYWLSRRIGIELACVYAHNCLVQMRWFADKSFVNHSLAFKDKEGTTNHIFTNLLQQVFQSKVKTSNLLIYAGKCSSN